MASIVGWAHTPFGKFDAETVESLVVKVANEALADAGIAATDVDEIVLGHFNAGFSPQDFTASLVLQADPNLRFKPATRVENACATGSAAVHQGVRAIEAGAAKIVLVVGVEQMTRTPGPEIGRNLLRASYLPEDGDTPGGFIARRAQQDRLKYAALGDRFGQLGERFVVELGARLVRVGADPRDLDLAHPAFRRRVRPGWRRRRIAHQGR